MIQLTTKWNSGNGTWTLTNHIVMFRVAIVDVIRCCKRSGRSVLSEREQVLWLIASITTTNHLLIAHISMVNADPTGLGWWFPKETTRILLLRLRLSWHLLIATSLDDDSIGMMIIQRRYKNNTLNYKLNFKLTMMTRALLVHSLSWCELFSNCVSAYS